MNTSSEAFLLGSVGQPNYAAAKAGIAALTVTTARWCSRYGVRANAICPRARTAMTAELMGPPPDGAVDPLAPEHVAPLVVYLASPAAETINGEVFVVHGGVAAVMEPPTVRSVFPAGTPDGMWTLDAVPAALGPAFGDPAPAVGFLCEDTLELATETIGFSSREASVREAAPPQLEAARQDDADGQAALGLAADVQIGAVRGADGLGDRQAEADAAAGRSAIRRNGSDSVGTASAGTTGPLLAMLSTAPPPYGPVVIRIQPPGSLCRTALSTRFQTMRSMSCWSPVVSAGRELGLHRQPEPGDAGRGQLQGVLGHRREVQQLAAGHALVADGQDQQRLDHVLGPVDGPADARRHVFELLRRAGRLGQGDVDGGAHDGERGAQLVRGVRDEPALGGERAGPAGPACHRRCRPVP